jgi:hypothetical protein
MKMRAFSFALTALLFVGEPCMAANTSFRPVGEASEYTVFAKSIEDLPVMQGLRVQEDNDVFIPFGDQRVVQTTLEGQVDIDEVYYFYEKVLPELGWTRIDPRTYERNGERLTMRASSANKDGMTYVRFDVGPVDVKK